MIFDSRPCELGEGPLWHPVREQLFWFDILNNRLLSRDDTGPLEWRFAERVSAAKAAPAAVRGKRVAAPTGCSRRRRRKRICAAAPQRHRGAVPGPKARRRSGRRS